MEAICDLTSTGSQPLRLIYLLHCRIAKLPTTETNAEFLKKHHPSKRITTCRQIIFGGPLFHLPWMISVSCNLKTNSSSGSVICLSDLSLVSFSPKRNHQNLGGAIPWWDKFIIQSSWNWQIQGVNCKVTGVTTQVSLSGPTHAFPLLPVVLTSNGSHLTFFLETALNWREYPPLGKPTSNKWSMQEYKLLAPLT